jgi:hypothetical protein
MGVEYARLIEEPDNLNDEDLGKALKVHYAKQLVVVPAADRKDALDAMVEACKRRVASMRRKTVQMRRGDR